MNELGRLFRPDSQPDRNVKYATGTVTAWTAPGNNTISVGGGFAGGGPIIDNVPGLNNMGTISANDHVAMLVYQGQYLVIGKIVD